MVALPEGSRWPRALPTRSSSRPRSTPKRRWKPRRAERRIALDEPLPRPLDHGKPGGAGRPHGGPVPHRAEPDHRPGGARRASETICESARSTARLWGSIARTAPVGRDLRVLTTVIEAATDLERIADHAVNISEVTLAIGEDPLIKPLDRHPPHGGEGPGDGAPQLRCHGARDVAPRAGSVRGRQAGGRLVPGAVSKSSSGLSPTAATPTARARPFISSLSPATWNGSPTMRATSPST